MASSGRVESSKHPKRTEAMARSSRVQRIEEVGTNFFLFGSLFWWKPPNQKRKGNKALLGDLDGERTLQERRNQPEV